MKIVIIGAGNLATNLGYALTNSGFNIIQIYSRTKKSAELLAKKLNTTGTDNIKQINSDADLYIISIPDDSLSDVLTQLTFSPKILIHTSGSLPLAMLKNYAKNIGVIYPLQTFIKNKISEFGKIPLCIEANNKRTEKTLIKISEQLSSSIYLYNSEQRSVIHLAAVFSCNFTNHMYSIAENILSKESIPLKILQPLLTNTLSNAFANSPAKNQTGPAIRNDLKIMAKHKEMLKENPIFEKIYSFVSESIYKHKLRK